jgi:hypothetical protein
MRPGPLSNPPHGRGGDYVARVLNAPRQPNLSISPYMLCIAAT